MGFTIIYIYLIKYTVTKAVNEEVSFITYQMFMINVHKEK